MGEVILHPLLLQGERFLLHNIDQIDYNYINFTKIYPNPPRRNKTPSILVLDKYSSDGSLDSLLFQLSVKVKYQQGLKIIKLPYNVTIILIIKVISDPPTSSNLS